MAFASVRPLLVCYGVIRYTICILVFVKMKRSYQSGAKKRQDKKKREEDASKCSSTLSAWLCPTTSTTTTTSTNITSTSSTETRPIIGEWFEFRYGI